jgi:hypothetical protein
MPAPLTSADMEILPYEPTDINIETSQSVAETLEEITEETGEITTAEIELGSVAEFVEATNAEAEEIIEAEIVVEEATTASLAITTTPDGATILVNRRVSGTTPFFADELEPREYNIMLLKEGFTLFDTTFTLSAGQNDTLSIALISENQQVQAPARTRGRDTATQAESEEEEKDKTDTLSEEELATKRRRMDRAGIIVFLSVMFVSMAMQESRSR